MFKSVRWRSEKNKFNAVLKLQFHATRLQRVGGDALTISLVPADFGKPTVRLEKAAIRDGSCYWENPVYETVKFFREPKTGKIHEKVYNIVVSNGSSKSNILGEVSIDFASYVESTKLSNVSLPLAKSDAVLHVSIQRLQENTDQRVAEEIENAKIHSTNIGLKTQVSNGDANETIKRNAVEDGLFNTMISPVAGLNGNHWASSGSDLTMLSSDSSSGFDTPREFGPKDNNLHQNPASFLSSPSHVSVLQKTTSFVSNTICEEQLQRSQWEWLGGSGSESSTEDSSSTLRDNGSREGSDIAIEKLKAELAAFSRQAELSELELQTLKKQIVKESKRGQDLFREVVSLKEQRDALKEECENLKALQKHADRTKVKDKLKLDGGDPFALLQELKQELNYEKDLNANLRLQLQKTQESNSELILAIHDLEEMLEQKNKEIFKFSNKFANEENGGELQSKSKSQTNDQEENALEELAKEHNDAKEVLIMEQKIMDLYSELEICKRDKDELEVQMEQLALDYEIVKQENHNLSYKLEQSQLQEQLKMQYEFTASFATVNELETQIESLETELKKQSEEFSCSLATITELETRVKDLEEEMENQAQGFEADLEILTRAKVEEEQRAIRAEEALRKMRWKNANTAERLQEEFNRLSGQMASTFEANEKLATRALAEASELRAQKSHLEELLLKAKEELQSVRDQYEVTLHELSGQIYQMKSEIEAKSKNVEQQKKQGEEAHRVLSQEILMLRAEIERLKAENDNLSTEVEHKESLKGELDHMKMSMKEIEMLLQRGNVERNEMESAIALLRKEAEKSMEELNFLRSLKDENELIIRNLRSELGTLKSRSNELNHLLAEDEFEKEKLRKQVFQLKGELKKKEDAFTSLERKLKDTNSRSTVLDGTKTTLRNNRSISVPRGPKEIANLKDKIKMLEGQIKSKESALETSTNSFLEKEKDLLNKIEELEKRLEELTQNSASSCEYESPKAATDSGGIILNGSTDERVKDTMNLPGVTPMIERNNEISSEKDVEVSALNARNERNFDELLSEMALLRERNKSMEGELKEMQERYSEISLKFAEVEGERQQLVMTLRFLKNAKRS